MIRWESLAPMGARVRGLALLLCGCWGLSGCPGEPPLLAVSVCGDVLVPDQVDAVRVSVLDSDRNEFASGVLQLVECPADRLKDLPQVLEFTPPVGEVRVVAQALKGGVEVARSERSVADASEGASVTVALQVSCFGLTCPIGKTCVDGTCELVADANGVACSSGQADPGPDAGAPEPDPDPDLDPVSDAGMGDAGSAPRYCDPESGGAL